MKLAQSLRRGNASAGRLVASEEISGFQVIANPDSATLPELRQELAALRSRLEDSLLTGSTLPSPAIEEAREALKETTTELSLPGAKLHRLLLRLSWAADHLHKAGEEAQLADELTPTLARLAVSAATLWSITNRLFALKA